MKTNHKYCFIILFLFIVIGAVVIWRLCYIQPSVKEEKPKKTGDPLVKFGQSAAKPVENGFVFINGKYIEPPYIVSRKGVDIFINDILVTKGKWPLPKYDLAKDAEGVPPGIHENMSYGEMMDALGEHFWQHARYIAANCPREKFLEKRVEYYRRMPCVHSVEMLDESTFVVKMKNGETSGAIWSSPLKPGDPKYPMTDEQYINLIDTQQWRIARWLKKEEKLWLFFPKFNREFCDWGREETARRLPLMIGVLKSNKTKEEKLSILVRMEILPRVIPMIIRLS